MGSRVMHYIISNQIADRLEVKDRTSFLLGGIAPDAVSPKELSHFYTGNGEDYTRSINYTHFYEKYQFNSQSDYILGYYTHLIADDLWLTGFYLPWLKNRMEYNSEIFDLYHHDFRLLNGKLLDYYGIKVKDAKNISISKSIPDLDEVKRSDVENLLHYLLQDMNYEESDLENKLNVFTLDQIVGYIETSVDKSMKVIDKLKLKV